MKSLVLVSTEDFIFDCRQDAPERFEVVFAGGHWSNAPRDRKLAVSSLSNDVELPFMIEGVFRGAVSYVCNLLGSDTGLRGARLFQDHNWHRVYNAEDRFPFSLPIDFLKSLLDKRGEHRIQSGLCVDYSSDRSRSGDQSEK